MKNAAFARLALNDEQYKKVERSARLRSGAAMLFGCGLCFAGAGGAFMGLIDGVAAGLTGVAEAGSSSPYVRYSRAVTPNEHADDLLYGGLSAALLGGVLVGASFEIEAHSADRQARRIVRNVRPSDIILSESVE